MGKWEKYFAIFRFSFVHSLRNYKLLVGLSVFLITCLIIFAHLWKVAVANFELTHLEPTQLLWYIAFNEWLLISLPSVQEGMEDDLRSGRLAYLLPRPVSYLWSIFFEGLGTLCARLIVLGFITFLFTWMRAGEIPFGIYPFMGATLLGFFAGAVALVFIMLVGVSAFWVRQVEPFHWIWEKLLFTLGGLMLPLIAYPEWLQRIARLTPYPAILGDRSALAIAFSWQSAFSVAGELLFWGVLAAGLLSFFYRKGLSIVNVEGG